jgi:hypothetical protein
VFARFQKPGATSIRINPEIDPTKKLTNLMIELRLEKESNPREKITINRITEKMLHNASAELLFPTAIPARRQIGALFLDFSAENIIMKVKSIGHKCARLV